MYLCDIRVVDYNHIYQYLYTININLSYKIMIFYKYVAYISMTRNLYLTFTRDVNMCILFFNRSFVQ